MPEISRFFGMIIAMFYDDHAPPHFHVRYGGQRAIIAIDTLGALVTEWAAQHQEELRQDWELARQHAPLHPIPPLE